jgi:hypothetical protein
VWALWHFCAQVFGVLSLDRIKANQFAPSDKNFDRAYSVLLMTITNPPLLAPPAPSAPPRQSRPTSEPISPTHP